MGQGRRDDVALLAQGAREEVDVMAPGGVGTHGHPRRQGLVVGVGVDEQQPCAHGRVLGRRM